MIKIKDILSTKGNQVWSIGTNSMAFDALKILAEKDIGALLVIDNGQVVGIFSERDYARKVILKGKSSRETTVGELMTREVYSISPDKSVEECMALMTVAHCRHMPVMEKNQLVGMVTIGDVVKAIINDQQITISDLQHYITGSEYVEVEDNP